MPLENDMELTSVYGSIMFAKNSVRPFMDHDCQDTLVEFETAAGSGRFSDKVFHIQKCSTCGLGFTNPIPTEETSYLLYETRESNDFQPDDSSLAARLKAIAARRDVHSFLRELDIPKGPALDYGCGNAAFTVALREAFPNAQVIGADMQQQPPKALAQSQYRSYAELAKMSGQYSIILCRHVLEHSYDPVGQLTKLSDLLMPGGVLVVEVPSLETKARVLFGKYWDGYYVPFHPIHFTREALRKAFLAANFSVIREGGAEMPKMGRSLQNFLDCKYNVGLFALGMLLHPVQIGIGLATDTSVCLRIWGRKTVK
jgi:SAM-dependent methyltransferase